LLWHIKDTKLNGFPLLHITCPVNNKIKFVKSEER
jgi:hypothetical protein